MTSGTDHREDSWQRCPEMLTFCIRTLPKPPAPQTLQPCVSRGMHHSYRARGPQVSWAPTLPAPECPHVRGPVSEPQPLPRGILMDTSGGLPGSLPTSKLS